MAEVVNKIEVSYRTVVFTVLFVLGLVFLFLIRDILLALFISIILMGALNPTINKLEKKNLPRWLAILLVYLVLVGLFVGLIVWLIPALVEQTNSLVGLLNNLPDNYSILGFSQETVQRQLQELWSLPTQIVKVFVSFVSNIVSVLAILVITFYLLLEHKNLDQYLFFLFGERTKDRVATIIAKIEGKLGKWVRAELVLMAVVGLLSYIGFRMLNLSFALPISILAGLLEIIPNIGPTVAAVPAVLLGFLQSPFIAILALIWSFIVQQLENNLIVPKVMEKSIGLNPLFTILSLAVGFKLAGVIGSVLAIPVFLAIEILLKELVKPKKINSCEV